MEVQQKNSMEKLLKTKLKFSSSFLLKVEKKDFVINILLVVNIEFQ